MVGFHSVQSAMHTGSRSCCLSHLQHRHTLICHFIENLHTATDCQGKPYHTDMLWLKEWQEAHALLTPYFCSSHICSAFPCGACWKPPNNNKTTATAGVGGVQLNFLTAGRDQHWQSIFCSYTRLASIIQRCVLLGDLALSLSSSRSHSLSHTCSRSAAKLLSPSSPARDGFTKKKNLAL